MKTNPARRFDPDSPHRFLRDLAAEADDHPGVASESARAASTATARNPIWQPAS